MGLIDNHDWRARAGRGTLPQIIWGDVALNVGFFHSARFLALACAATLTPAIASADAGAPLASQDNANAIPAATPSSTAAAAQPAASADDGSIVVTALRRSQSLQSTPAAVTVISGELLQRQQVVDVRGIQNLVPSARFSAANTSTRIYIRGVGSALDFYWIPETTAVNYNGVYLPRFATIGGLFDIESVQILPGPQGVLYGKSAGGGAVIINSNRPTDRVEASGRFEFGNYNAFHIEGMGNVPVTDRLAVRGAFVVNKHDGYQSFGLDSDDSFSVRLSALWRPTSDLSVYLWGTHFKQTGTPTAANYIPFLAGGDPWFIPARDPVTNSDNSTGSRDNYKYTIGGTDIRYNLDGVSIDYTGSVLRQTERSLRKLVGNDQVVDNAQTQYTQALHISGKAGKLEWIGGIDWFDAGSRFNVLFGPHQFGQILPTIKNHSISGFAQGIFSVTPSLRIVAGTRYNHDSLYLNGVSSACFAACFYSPITYDKSWNHLDLKGGLEADVAPHVLAYANVQTGYAPGTLNVFTNISGLSKDVQPQTLLAYTAGLKSTVNDGRITLNVEVFDYNYKKLIIQAFNTSIGQLTLFNAPKATVYGLQFTSAFRPSHNDTITANVAYTHGRYGSFIASPGQRDLDGLQMVFTPDWSATLSYDHSFDLANGGRVDARVSTYLSSSYWGTFDHSAGAQQGDYHKTDALLSYHPSGDAWSIGVFVKNIENTAVKTALTSAGYPAPYAGATFLEPPRTYGLSLGFKL